MRKERIMIAKLRSRVRREMAALEDAEYESGELNLVPYLDIVTNVVIFLLATVTSTAALGNLNVAAPRYTDPATQAAIVSTEDKQQLNLTVAISDTGFIVGGAGGVMKHQDGSLPTIKCAFALQANRCPAYVTTRVNEEGTSETVWVDKYDYDALGKLIQKIKSEYKDERQAILSADRSIPYQVVVRTMDVLRGRATANCTGQDGCYFDQVILSAGVE